MKSIEYQCKFCGLSGTAHYDESAGLERVEVWKKMLACNRCADFHSSRLRLFRSITDVCVKINQARIGRFKNLDEIESGCHQTLEFSTKKLCELVNRFYRLTNLWSADFVAILMERPDCAWQSMDLYVSRRKRDSFPSSHADLSHPKERE